MKYRLRPGEESFDIVDGPDAGRRYLKGRIYTETPAGYGHRFEPLPEPRRKKPKPMDWVEPDFPDDDPPQEDNQ